jgi:hypothetical protein
MYNRADLSEQEAFDEVCWDLSDEEGHPEIKPRPKRLTITGSRKPETEKIVYIDTTPSQTKAYATYLVIGLVVGLLLALLCVRISGTKGTLSSGIAPISTAHTFATLTPAGVKQFQSDCLVYQPPTLQQDMTMFAEHGEANDSVTENALICNIYQDSAARAVYGAEYIVSAVQRPMIDEGKVCNAAERYFTDALRLISDNNLATSAEQWVKTAIHDMNRPGAVSQATFGDVTLTCYGAPWMRVLTVTPK